MNARWIQFACIGLCGTVFAVGCRNKKVSSTSSTPQAEPVVTIHWAGKNAVKADRGAEGLIGIWNLPESKRLESEILDKLALSLWRDTLHIDNWKTVTNYGELVNATPGRLLRPLLDDIVEQECQLNIITNGQSLPEVTLSIRLDNARSALWQANLSSLKQTLSNKFHLVSSKKGEWTQVTVSKEELPKGYKPIDLRSMKENTRTDWVIVEINGEQIPELNRGPLNIKPKISLSIFGDKKDVLTEGKVSFKKDLGIKLDPWMLPTNLMQHPLVALTSVGGIAPALQMLAPFSDLKTPTLPNQLHIWNRQGPPVQMFFALPTDNARVLLERLAPLVISTISSNAPIENYGVVQKADSSLLWTYFPYASPHLGVATNSGIEFLQGGFGLPQRNTNTMPPELLSRIMHSTNLIFFDWEVTGERAQQIRYLDDIARMSLDTAHRPRIIGSSASLQWLALVLTNHLRVASTEAHLDAPNQIGFSRKSQVGFTAAEINFLLNWFEDPDFPSGLDRFWKIDPTPPPKRPTKMK